MQETLSIFFWTALASVIGNLSYFLFYKFKDKEDKVVLVIFAPFLIQIAIIGSEAFLQIFHVIFSATLLLLPITAFLSWIATIFNGKLNHLQGEKKTELFLTFLFSIYNSALWGITLAMVIPSANFDDSVWIFILYPFFLIIAPMSAPLWPWFFNRSRLQAGVDTHFPKEK